MQPSVFGLQLDRGHVCDITSCLTSTASASSYTKRNGQTSFLSRPLAGEQKGTGSWQMQLNAGVREDGADGALGAGVARGQLGHAAV
uniref:Uncharacterized protein n=1 Tax=Knipowitschia caucasica TaxID=637954 RepID=A0AAV2K2N5_KNICA